MNLAAEIYERLDDAGLTPSIHWAAAPHDWRTACESIAQEIETEMEKLLLWAELANHPVPRMHNESLLNALRRLHQ